MKEKPENGKSMEEKRQQYFEEVQMYKSQNHNFMEQMSNLSRKIAEFQVDSGFGLNEVMACISVFQKQFELADREAIFLYAQHTKNYRRNNI